MSMVNLKVFLLKQVNIFFGWTKMERMSHKMIQNDQMNDIFT